MSMCLCRNSGNTYVFYQESGLIMTPTPATGLPYGLYAPSHLIPPPQTPKFSGKILKNNVDICKFPLHKA